MGKLPFFLPKKPGGKCVGIKGLQGKVEGLPRAENAQEGTRLGRGEDWFRKVCGGPTEEGIRKESGNSCPPTGLGVRREKVYFYVNRGF